MYQEMTSKSVNVDKQLIITIEQTAYELLYSCFLITLWEKKKLCCSCPKRLPFKNKEPTEKATTSKKYQANDM